MQLFEFQISESQVWINWSFKFCKITFLNKVWLWTSCVSQTYESTVIQCGFYISNITGIKIIVGV